MLIKEYRIPLPLTAEEYQIAQLFMIQKKSRLESSGVGSGVEIIKNEPYKDGPCVNSGQYTYKIYHIGNRIPLWIRNILPSSALEAHEESWNSYPYTRTRYSCPMISHFSVEVETRYLNDSGNSVNVFNLSQDELKNRVIDVIDFVRRGPLTENWIDECISNGWPLMCAYKLCKVEFKYWGLQTRGEKWIHELALRGTMLRAHRQAWVWQDEWYNLGIDDIRKLENETKEYLAALMTPKEDEKRKEKIEEEELIECGRLSCSNSVSDIFFDCSDKFNEREEDQQRENRTTLVRWSSELLVNEEDGEKSPPRTPRPSNNRFLLILVFHGDLFPTSSTDSKIIDTNTLRSTLETLITCHYSQLKGRVHVQYVTCGNEFESLAHSLNSLSSSFGNFHPSIGQLLSSDIYTFNASVNQSILTANKLGKVFEECGDGGEIFVIGDYIGGIIMYEALAKSKNNEVNNFDYNVDNTSNYRTHRLHSHSSSPSVNKNSSSNSRSKSPMFTSSVQLSPLSSGKQGNNSKENSITTTNTSHSYSLSASAVDSPNNNGGQFFNFDNKSKIQGRGCSPSPSFVTDEKKNKIKLASRQASTNSSQEPSHYSVVNKPISETCSDVFLDFHPTTAFLLGCPLALLLTQRQLLDEHNHQNLSLSCDQLYNLFYPLDLCGTRLEPVLNPNLAQLPAPKVPRYQRFHLLGDGNDIHFDVGSSTPMIWGSRRVDHELYCPPEMSTLPALALPNILHVSYWESKDVGAFILRTFLRFDDINGGSLLPLKNLTDHPPLNFQMPLSIWNKRRTRFKVANLSANHRANDLLVVEDAEEQIVNARFCYGPMDLVALSQENVLVYVLQSGSEWSFKGVETTDKHGRVSINLGKSLPIGIHYVKLIVQGDHTFLSVSIAVVRRGTPLVVFSIDGSLTASVSVTGRKGYLIIYLTARPDMQQRLVSAWLATHNFPHGLLFFTPSLSTEPLKQKMQFMKHLTDIGLCVQAAYGSSKDIPVYSNAGLEHECIFIVGSSHRRKHLIDCISLENGYSPHLHDLHSGRIEIAQPVEYFIANKSTNKNINNLSDEHLILENTKTSTFHFATQRSPMQRTLSFGPRTGKYNCSKKISQTSSLSTN
ncbi:DDHD domain-containing protein [Meloidogyne graminicola]|uniref:DDHD domain-containing protein n=1 Tax=Meloidogyne graminicola TaxID=189291 RepID=A0A8S9ZPJ8_9BILA|nr:DDHD domain-containing protein [Meloidogyne graminicola]